MVTAVPVSRHHVCLRANECGKRASHAQRQELPLQPLVHRNSAWTVLAASTFMAPLKRRREGRPLQAAAGEVSAVSLDEEVVSHGTMNDDEPNTVLRYGVTNGSLLPWTGAKLPDLLPEVHFSGKVLPPEAAGCGPDQLAFLLSMLETEEVDFVIAPAKDVGLELPQGLVAAAVLREDARDAFVVRPQLAHVGSLSDLPPGSKVCVSGARRRMQLAARFPELCVEESKLPCQSVLRRLYSLDYDAVVAAAAGLHRTALRLSDEVSPLDIDELMPALCQGALTMLCRAKDEQIVSLLGACDDAAARTCVVAERSLMKKLGRLPDDAAVGGVAELRSGNRLSLNCMLVLPSIDSASPRILQAHKEDVVENREALVQSIVAELRNDAEVASFQGERPSAPIKAARAMEDDDDLEDDVQGSGLDSTEALPGLGAERLPISEFDCAGGTAYTGRVCAVLANRRGVLVDINCEIPAFWCPELVSSPSSSSSSSSRSGSSKSERTRSDPEELPRLGSEMEVYCCPRHSGCLRALREPPPRLARRAGVAPLRLEELRPGLGPWRAIVISATDDGTLVDFNCEIPGLLRSDQIHLRGEELRVYCHRVDVPVRMCIVSTVKETRAETSRRQLEDLISGDTSARIRGTVLRVTGSGVFVDVNCEVQGYLSPMDIDMMASTSLCKGYEVTVYVKSVNLVKRQVALSMFPMRKVRIINGQGLSEAA
ncbi:hemC [Symbiodinium necroappetens]|uniref:hydroxymethylbilane synthase n=1 Tax=Symbiodinium necroappetens TaxID=1628268 RepID=A0A813AAQ7_9DINO|nr:hemC [Symbiodinium necroappetens]